MAEKAAEVLNIDPANTYQGYSLNDADVIAKIKRAKPDLLFVGLGSPKQEKWASKHLKELNVPLAMCVGGSFDVIAGTCQKSPGIHAKDGDWNGSGGWSRSQKDGNE